MTALVLGVGLMPGVLASTASAQAPVGQGFTLTAGDLDFILKQIKISERHAGTLAADPANPDPCAGLLGGDPDQIPTGGVNGETLPWGLRTVDGTCNNLIPGQSEFGAADILFPRRVSPGVFEDAEVSTFDSDGPGPATAGQPTSYQQTSGSVFDSEPRVVSNLIVDQTDANPAAVAAAGEGAVADPTGTLPIANEAPDVGLSAPFNGLFTLFGQFFDHGLDLVDKGGGTVFIPLKADDPLVTEGPDGTPGTGDEVPPSQRFMVLTRATNQPGGVQEHTTRTTSFVDQNQTYTSHPSHQVFLREYENNTAGDPVSIGALLTNADDGMATWADVKTQASTLLGIDLADTDALNVPLLATDPYGKFIPGANGYPQLATATGLVEGNPAANGGQGVAVPGNVIRTGHAFLADIAHHAVPVGRTGNPLTADTDPGVVDDNNPNTYDDEMLNSHFMAGDGRVNENIGLTAIHHVFHSEHNRLVGDVKNVLAGVPAEVRAEWQLATSPDGWNGERLFQAARFVTEMEYQHLAFEEFARKVQPLVNLFGEGGTGYRTDLDPSIKAEFAHAVYRFGHSMLTDTVARTNVNGTKNDIGLIEAFLNPQEFTDGGTAGPLTPDQAAGSVVRGMSRQVGQEIDEFVIEALRNNLLGLPLDLATINIARARDTGIPTLNGARRAFYAESNNPALVPYTSWEDLSFNLKHRESLVNFIAAYGTHPTITGDLEQRRTAAELLIAADPDGVSPTPENPAGTPASPADSTEFMTGTGAWANDGDVTTTGVDAIDLWIGGLAEKQMVFGGVLGPTFNYVFELQMEDLQFGDRFYYLSRTAGLNLLTQLEGNSFAELISRNTSASGMPADVFSRPDYIFNVANLGTSGPIPDDPETVDYNEGDRSTAPGSDLTRTADGTIRYFGDAHVVFNGTAGNDKVRSSEGDDTVRGNDGNDRIESGDGNDSVIGGNGDDIMTDLNGDDTLKGGDGDDALASGQGFGGDLNQGGLGKDFIYGGNDVTETFAGPGDDFVFAGDDLDTVFGDDGDDWLEGGAGPFNLLQGDSGNPFADDPNGGHDVMDADGGEQDYDAEGGEDIMLMGPGIQRAEGMLGFDWATHRDDPQPADSDMNFTGLLPPSVDTLRDRFDLTEALSGWKFDDQLKGDDRIAGPEGENPEGTITPGHALTTAGIARIAGLQAVLGAGVTSYNAGNIILGGAGADTIEGRGGNDIIDGDKWLNAQLRVPNLATTDPADRMLVDNMGAVQADVFAGRMDPGDISIVRAIETTPAGTSVDTAVFSGPIAEYDITRAPDGTVTVVHARPAGGTDDNGTDTIRNVEDLRFADQTVDAVPAGPTVTGQTPADGATGIAVASNITAVFSEAVTGLSTGLNSTNVVLRNTATGARVTSNVSYAATTRRVTINPALNLAPGTNYTATITGAPGGLRASAAPNAPVVTASWSFTTAVPNVAPTVTARTPANNATNVNRNTNVTVTFSEPVTGVNSSTVTLTYQGGFLNLVRQTVPATVTYNPTTRVATLNPNAALGSNRTHTIRFNNTAIRDASNAPLSAGISTFRTGTAQ